MVKIECEPTYTFLKPFCFMGKKLNNSVELLEAFANNWDIAVSVFKRGDMVNFWAENVGMSRANGQWHREEEFQIIHDRMWQIDENINEDVLFQKVFYLIEPASDLIPVPGPGWRELAFMERVKFLEYIEDIFLMYNAELFTEILEGDLKYNPKWDVSYNVKYEKLLMICQMFREKCFYCWDLHFIQECYEKPKVASNCNTMQRKSFDTDRAYYNQFKRVLGNATRVTKHSIQAKWAFTLDDEICYQESDFFNIWYCKIDKWDLSELNSFIKKLVNHQGTNSFADFILGCKKPEVIKKFCEFSEDWKNRPNTSIPYFTVSEHAYLIDSIREQKWRGLKKASGKADLEECLPKVEESLQKFETVIKNYQESYWLYERIFIILYELHGSTPEKSRYEDAYVLASMKNEIKPWEKGYTEIKNFHEDLSYAIKFLEEVDFEGIWKHTFHEKPAYPLLGGVSSELVKLLIFHNLCADFTENCEENREKFKDFYEKNKKDMAEGWRLAIEEHVKF